MFKQVVDSFQKGFSLANKSWGLFLLALSLPLLGNISSLLGNSFIGITLQVVGFLLIFIYFGFSFSLPIFLVHRQQGKSLSFGNIVFTSLKNTKRLILFTILTLLFIAIGGILGLFLIVIFLYGGNFYFMQNLPPGLYFWDFMLALIIGLCSFFTFAPIYFSLEKNGVLSSIKKSVSFSFKHLNFIIVIFIIYVSTHLVGVLFFNNYQNLYQLFIRNTIYVYESFLISAASLIFYQNLTKNVPSSSQKKNNSSY